MTTADAVKKRKKYRKIYLSAGPTLRLASGPSVQSGVGYLSSRFDEGAGGRVGFEFVTVDGVGV